MTEQTVAATRPSATLLRRLGAIISDSLVMVGLLLLGTLMFVPLLNHLDARAMTPSEVGWGWSAVYWLWLLSIWVVFFCFFWSRSGQTVGMRAWHVRVESNNGELLNWSQSMTRLWLGFIPWLPSLLTLTLAEQFGSSALKYLGQGLLFVGAINLLSMYFDPLKRTWHDRVSGSRIIFLPKL